jgi:hypothetical protein
MPRSPPLGPRRGVPQITPEIVALFRRAVAGDADARMKFRVLTKERPWEVSPLDIHDIAEPEAGPDAHYDRPWDASWWKAAAFRAALEDAAAKF